MSLLVPLAVRVGDSHVTREVSGVAFVKNAVGGVQSITLRLSRPLDTLAVSPLDRVYLYDARTAEVVAEGRISDLGRAAGTDGQQWDLVAFGPAQHASDRTFPYIMVDTRLDAWFRSNLSTKNATTVNDERGDDIPSLLVAAEEGKTVGTGWQGFWRYTAIKEAGQKLARVRCDIDAGVTAADYIQQINTRTNFGGATVAASATASTTAGSLGASVVANFTNGHNVVDLVAQRDNTATTGAEAHWFEFWNICVKALRLDKTGTEVTTGYGSSTTVLAHQVVEDLLGRVLGQFDGANATIDTGGVYGIDQMAYPDGVTAEQVLEDLMALEPAYRWYGGPSTSSGKYSFTWEPWPTTVRYEVTLDDGGSFPVSTQELYNRVTVRYTLKSGQTKTLTVSGSCPILDDAGITRSTIIDAGDEIGSAAAAQRLADNFLAEHKQPANAGQLTVARPVLDLVSGRMVEPFEIEPGNLIRVRGVESYPDALNASSKDGLTVFRIWSMSYASDSAAAVLELDVPARSTTNALKALAKRRNRKR